MNTLFILFSTGAWVSGSLILLTQNPVHAVFFLVLVFLHAAGLLCLLGLEYFALVQLMVYVGALAILFLFVVMLLDIPATTILAYQKGAYPTTMVILLSIVLGFWFALAQSDKVIAVQPSDSLFLYDWGSRVDESSTVEQLGVALYGVHPDLLIVASLILLVAMIGAVGLTLKRKARAPVHDIFAQHNREFMSVTIQKSFQKRKLQ